MTTRQSPGRDCQRANAFTLIEVLVASLLVGICFTALYSGVSSGLVTAQLSREDLRATQVLLEKSEILRLYGWQQIAGLDSPDEPDEVDSVFTADDNLYEMDVADQVPDTFTALFDPSGQAKGNFTFNGIFTITNAPFAQAYTNSLRLVKIEVSWQSFNIVRKRELQTLISRYGVSPRAK